VPDRVDVTIVEVWEAIINHLRTSLGLNSSTCFWWLDDGEPPPPTTSSVFVTLAPDGGTFDGSMFDGGGIRQVTVETGLAVTIHSTNRLDTGMRDEQFLTHATLGIGALLNRVITSLTGFDPAVFGNSDNAPALRAEISPTGFSKPTRLKDDKYGSVTVVFNVSFDWLIGSVTTTTSTTTTAGP
jgi:hypothetical protein